MICPKCNSSFYLPQEKFIYRDGKVFIVISCPKCLEVFKEIETKYGQGKRLVLIFFGILLGMFTLISLMSFIPFHYFMSAMLIVLIIIFAFTTYLKIKTAKTDFFSETVKKETIQNDNEEKNNSVVVTKHDDPLMNKIVGNIDIQNNKKDAGKKIKYFSVIFIVMMIIFNIYPSVIKIKDNFTKMYKLNTGAANKARDLRGEQLAERLNINYDVYFAYPVDLNDELVKSSDDFFKEVRVDFEKDVLGKEIKLSDFTYKSTKHEFELCLNDGEYSKCWRGKDGKRY